MTRSTLQDDARTTWQLILSATMLRLLVATLLPLGVDESYEAVVSRTLSLSYFDHPPAVFWITHAAASLGGESPIALRWPFVMLFAVTSWLLFLLAARLFSTRAGLWAVVVAQVIPVFSLSSGSWVLPDGPLLCASVATALALAYALPVMRESGADAIPVSATGIGASWRWLLVGLALGAAGLSKYHAVLLGAGALVFMVTDARSRRWLVRVEPWIALLVALACVVPVFVWNARHDWVSFRFQSGRAAGKGNPLTALLQNLAGQAGYLLPWFWLPLVLLLARGLRTGRRDRATWFCCCLGAGPVIVFTLASLGGRAGLPHWPAPGFFLLLPLLGAAIARWEGRAPNVARRRMVTAASVFVALVAIVTSHAATGWVAALVPSLHKRDPAFELLEYRSLRDSLMARGLLQRSAYVATSDWIRGAKIGYALGSERPVL
ncbi:MAG TPA: glycosyltransferase family 39 protein, partial [Gemmatimonadaceae bacterium]|nr:glycosyltransferase family 39 protein [Gemmatimonadaceae bacterium]